jgi:hypothetical protein
VGRRGIPSSAISQSEIGYPNMCYWK